MDYMLVPEICNSNNNKHPPIHPQHSQYPSPLPPPHHQSLNYEGDWSTTYNFATSFPCWSVSSVG